MRSWQRILALALAAGGLGTVAAVGAAGPAADDGIPRRVHADGGALRRATLDASDALLRDDLAEFARAATAMKAASPPLPSEAAERFGTEVLGFDRASHAALDRVREHAADGVMDEAFDSFFWVERGCRECHAQARTRGLLPESGPLWRPDGTPFTP